MLITGLTPVLMSDTGKIHSAFDNEIRSKNENQIVLLKKIYHDDDWQHPTVYLLDLEMQKIWLLNSGDHLDCDFYFTDTGLENLDSSHK